MNSKCSGTVILGLLCAVFVALTLNQGVYVLLYTMAMLSLVLLLRVPRSEAPRPLYQLKLPLLFVAVTALSPGNFFVDMPLATPMGAAFLCGMGAVLAEMSLIKPAPAPRHESDAPSACWSALLSPKHFPLLHWSFFLLLLCLNLQLLRFFLDARPTMLWDSRLSLRFDHPNVLGYVAAWGVLYGCIVLPRVFAYSRNLAAVWMVLIAGGATVVALAGSRGVYAGLMLGLVPVLLLVYRRRLLLILLVLAVVGGVAMSSMPERHQTRIVSALRNPISDITIQARQPIWRAALAGFCTSPLLGNGLRSFADHHEQWVRENKQAMEATTPVLETRVANPHSLYVGLLYAYGVLGVGLLLLLAGNGVRLAVHTLRKSPVDCGTADNSTATHNVADSNADLDAIFFLASVCFLTGAGVVDYPLHRKEGILMLFLPLGLLYARALLADSCQNRDYPSHSC